MPNELIDPPPPRSLLTPDGGVSDRFYGWLRTLKSNTSDAIANLAAAQGDITNLQDATFTDFVPGFIEFVANKDYVIVNYIPVPLTVVTTVTWCTSGSCFATFKKNGSIIGGSANTVTTSRQLQAHSSSDFAVGDYLTMTLSGNSNCRNMSFAVLYTRPLFT